MGWAPPSRSMIERRRKPRTSSWNRSSSGPRWARRAVRRRTSAPPPTTPAMPHMRSVLEHVPLFAARVGGTLAVELPAVPVVRRAAAAAVDAEVAGDLRAADLAGGVAGLRGGRGRVVHDLDPALPLPELEDAVADVAGE